MYFLLMMSFHTTNFFTEVPLCGWRDKTKA